MQSDLSWQSFQSHSEIRTLASRLTDEFAQRLGYVFAQWLAERLSTTPDRLVIAVGRDSRASGPRLLSAVTRGLTAADCDVLDCGLCTTPALHLSVFSEELRAHGAIMVTGSHDPADRNGFKFLLREGHMSEQELSELIARAEQTRVPRRLVREVDILSIYRERLNAMAHERLEDDALKPLLGLHVIVDAGCGAGGFYADFLESLGADVDGSLNLEPTGVFPGGTANPESPDSLKAISERVVEYGADLGVLFDPDCDRAAIVDQNGRVIHRNRLIALIAAILLEKEPGATFVTDSVTSSGLATFITEWGGIHYRYRRGARNVIEEAIRLNGEDIDCPLAIETSGHAAFRENYFLDDGMYLVTRLVCEALDRKREGQTLSSLIDELQEPVEAAEMHLELRGDEPRAAGQEIIERVLSHTLDNPEWRLANDNREGVRIEFNLEGGVRNGWFLLRHSLHQTALVLNAESDIPGGLHTMLQQLCDLLNDCEALDLTPLKEALER